MGKAKVSLIEHATLDGQLHEDGGRLVALKMRTKEKDKTGRRKFDHAMVNGTIRSYVVNDFPSFFPTAGN